MHTKQKLDLTTEFYKDVATQPTIISEKDSELIDRLFNFAAFYYSKLAVVNGYKTEMDTILQNEGEFGGEYLTKLQDCVDYYDDMPF